MLACSPTNSKERGGIGRFLQKERNGQDVPGTRADQRRGGRKEEQAKGNVTETYL